MNHSVLIALSALLIFITSCKEEEIHICPSEDSEYIVFGRYIGMCAGTEECVEIFKLTETQLLEDVKDAYPNATNYYNGMYTLLSQTEFDVASSLYDAIPDSLLSYPETTIGMPDSHDQGGLYLEYHKEGVHRFWLIDTDLQSIPSFLHPLVLDIDKTINQLQ